MRGLRRQQLFLAINQIRGVERCKLESVTMSNCIGRACLYAISAENAAVVVNVINLGVALRAADAIFGRVLRRLNIDAICRAISRAQKTGYTLLQTVLVALQNV